MNAREIARQRFVQFAEMIAEDVSINEAARRLGVSRKHGMTMMKKLKTEMGEA